MDIQWQYTRGRGVVYVMCHYGMAVWGRGINQELWYVVDGNVINSALHGEKKVVVKVGDLYGLVDKKRVYLSRQWIGIIKYRRYGLKVSRYTLWVISTDCHRAVIVINY